MPISFPGLFGDWSFNPDPIAVHIGHGIYWYGIILAIGLLAGLALCMKQAKRYGLTEDNVLDMVLWAVPSCIIGARLYYVIFYLDLYRNADGSLNWGEMVAVWDGGLAIYGAVIAGAIVAFFYTRHKKIKMGAMTDLAVMGLLLGQCIGRWANFINREAFGAETTLPWRMRLWTSATEYIEVHPTFFYESLWNLIGLLLILFVVSKARRFDGENTWFYFLWYGLGRFWIEGLRTDSLLLVPSMGLRASQLVAAIAVVGGIIAEVILRRKYKDQTLMVHLAITADNRKLQAQVAKKEGVAVKDVVLPVEEAYAGLSRAEFADRTKTYNDQLKEMLEARLKGEPQPDAHTDADTGADGQ